MLFRASRLSAKLGGRLLTIATPKESVQMHTRNTLFLCKLLCDRLINKAGSLIEMSHAGPRRQDARNLRSKSFCNNAVEWNLIQSFGDCETIPHLKKRVVEGFTKKNIETLARETPRTSSAW